MISEFFEDLALGVAAADAGEIGEGTFEHRCGLRRLAAGHRLHPGAQPRRNLARRQAALFAKAAQACDARPQPLDIPDRGLCKPGVEIGKGEAGGGKMPPGMGDDLDPFLVERRACIV